MSRVDLAKGGRIGTAQAWAASALSIKPILEVSTISGYTEPVERVRTKRRAVQRLLEIVRERVGEAPLHGIVHHSGVPSEGEDLKARASAEFDCLELYLTPLTPVVGTHVGPGAVGLAFYAER